jgi:hypothetical protein
MIYTHSFDGLTVKTGDILCTQDGVENSLFGQIWRLLGKILPGEIDHCLVYIGPGGRCVESAARGVIVFEMPGSRWDALPLNPERLLLDTLVGVAYPLDGRGLSEAEELHSPGCADYCLYHASQRKPYNFNYFDPDTDRAFTVANWLTKPTCSGIDLTPASRSTGFSPETASFPSRNLGRLRSPAR